MSSGVSRHVALPFLGLAGLAGFGLLVHPLSNIFHSKVFMLFNKFGLSPSKSPNGKTSDIIIPPELIMKILSRVPVERILCFRRVCKAWCCMIDDPYFVKIHSDYHLFKINDYSNDVGYLVVNHAHKVCFLSLDFREKFKTASIRPNPFLHSHKYIASCNGLILLCHYRSENILSIWNPLTKELHRLPIPEVKTRRWRTIIGFGYDSISDDYKVLKHLRALDNEERHVYSLKSNSWKQIDYFPYSITKWTSGVFLNDALHWVATSEENVHRLLIVAVSDLGSENCRINPLSFPIDRFVDHTRGSYDLVVVDGCLSVSLYYYSGRFEVWLMKDYGVESSWTRLFSVEVMRLEIKHREGLWLWRNFPAQRTLRIVSYSKSKGLVLFQTGNNELFWVNLDNNSREYVSVPENLRNWSSQVFRPSLVRIK